MRCASRAATGHSPTVRCAGRPWPRCGPERVGRCGTSGEGDEFLYWYVNFERDVRRTSLGFDIVDEKLDLIARPDGRIVWKDGAELEQAAVLGLVDADEVRATAERVLADPPWPTGWEDFRPDAEWELPQLPPGWDVLSR